MKNAIINSTFIISMLFFATIVKASDNDSKKERNEANKTTAELIKFSVNDFLEPADVHDFDSGFFELQKKQSDNTTDGTNKETSKESNGEKTSQ